MTMSNFKMGWVDCIVHGKQRAYFLCETHIHKLSDIKTVSPWTELDGSDVLCYYNNRKHSPDDLIVVCEAHLLAEFPGIEQKMERVQ